MTSAHTDTMFNDDYVCAKLFIMLSFSPSITHSRVNPVFTQVTLTKCRN